MAEAKKQRVIDDNMHFLPTDLFTNEKVLNGFLYSAPITMGVKAYLDKTPDGTKNQVVLATDSGEEILNYVEGDYTLETKIQAMDDAGVDIAMLRMPVWQEWLPLEICKIVNDQAADMCKRSEGRLVANAVVPPYGRPEDIAEGGSLPVKVFSNENLGMNTLVHGHMGDNNRISAKLRGWTNYKNGDIVNVTFKRKHFFNKETTNAIRKEAR